MKITLDWTTKQLTLEGAGGDIGTLLDQLKVIMPQIAEIRIINEQREVPAQAPPLLGGAGMPPAATGRKMSMREFGKALAPESSLDRVAVLAYYANRVDGRAAFSPKEMSEWFGSCGWPKPKLAGALVFDAKRKKDLVETKGHGQWAISTTGENLVIDLMEQKKVNPGGAS